MGLENRQYYRDDEQYSAFGRTGSATRSIVVTIILINVAIYVLAMFAENLTDLLALKPDQAYKPWYWWQFLTYGFDHSSLKDPGPGIFHLIGNMIVLFFLGRPLEDRLGRDEFLKFYLIAIIVSGIGYCLFNQLVTGSNRPVLGASGGVSAITALFICLYPKQQLLLFGVLPIPAWLVGVLIIGGDLLNLGNPDSMVASEAHIVGVAFGAIYYFGGLNFRWLTFNWLKRTLKPKPNLKVHKPDADSRLQNQADEILEKIAEQGEKSLTNKERKILNKYSKSVRSKRQ